MSAPRFESLCGQEYLSVLNNTGDGSPFESSGRYCLIYQYHYLAVAQLVEHGIVVGYNFPVVLGSNPGGEI